MKAIVSYEEKKYSVELGSKIGDLIKRIDEDYNNIYAVILNNRLHSMEHLIKFNSTCVPVRYNSAIGRKMYENTLKYIFLMALSKVNPDYRVKCANKIGYNLFIFPINFEFDDQIIHEIKLRMHMIISSSYPIKRCRVSMEEAEKCYEKMGYDYHVDKYNPCCDDYTIYTCENYANYLYARLLPSTGCIRAFDIMSFNDGVIIVMPEKKDNTKLPNSIDGINVFKSITSTVRGIERLEELNSSVINGRVRHIIHISELAQNTKMLNTANAILGSGSKFVFIAGPSSSGKTTFSKKLAMQLEVLGKKSLVISMDDYFKDFYYSPTDENGNKNFDSINHLDIDLFKNQIYFIATGEEVKMPKYNFCKNGGEKEYLNPPVCIDENTILIIEGIHAINPLVYNYFSNWKLFKIFVSPLVTLNYDNYTKVSSSNARFLRRLVRDYNTRGASPEYTFKSWENVVSGEEENIFPYVNDVDLIFNTHLMYEICVLKTQAEMVLRECDKTSQYYYLAKDLYEMLQRFESISSEFVPADSILREFIGGSIF